MVTPGTTTNDKLLEHNSNNFLAGIHFGENDQYGLAFLDISTGECFIAESDREYADKLIQGFKPAEVVFQRHKQKNFKENFGAKVYSYTLDEWIFTEAYAEDTLLKHFQTHSLKGFGVDEMRKGLIAASAILHYLKETEHPNLQHIIALQRIDRDDFLWMDRFTIRNLELISRNSEAGHTLLDVLDNTASPMGARLLKRWIVFPLKDIQKINERLDTVEFFIKETDLRNKISQHIRQCGDIERLVSKIPLKKINPREVLQLARGLKQVEIIKQLCLSSSNEYLKRLGDALNPCPYIAEKIFKEIIDNPPALAVKGGMINSGISHELDELRNISHSGKSYLVQLQQKEAEATGISSLKIGFNNVFGYYLEVTHVHKNKVPAEWMRKQTLTNAERYITPELKDYEEKILNAEESINRIESQLWDEFVLWLGGFVEVVQLNSRVVAQLDCLMGFARLSIDNKYAKPVISDGHGLSLKGCRH